MNGVAMVRWIYIYIYIRAHLCLSAFPMFVPSLSWAKRSFLDMNCPKKAFFRAFFSASNCTEHSGDASSRLKLMMESFSMRATQNSRDSFSSRRKAVATQLGLHGESFHLQHEGLELRRPLELDGQQERECLEERHIKQSRLS